MRSKVSKFQALYRYFPDRPWGTEFGVLRTTNITGRVLGDEYDSIRQDIAHLVSADFRRRLDREARAVRSRRSRQAQATSPPIASAAQSEDDLAAAAFLAALAEGEEPVGGQPLRQAQGLEHDVSSASIELREVGDESEIQAEVFPYLFWCSDCGRCYYLDPNGPNTFQCGAHQTTAPDLQQLTLVFSCARCANMEPLLPFSVQMRRLHPGPIRCPNQHDVTLNLSSGLVNARWGCTDSACNYWRNAAGFDNTKVTRVCYCHIADDQFLSGDNAHSVMAPRPATSGEIASPLHVSYIKDSRGNDMNLASLRNLHRDTEGSFTLPGLDPRTRDRLSRLRVSEFFDVPEIQSILVNYGYRSEVRPNPEVPAGERYARFYQPQSRVERFRAYLSIVTGKGLVIGLDQLRLAQLTWDRMGPLPEFSSRIEQELASVASAPLQQLLDIRPNPQSYSIIKLLHALEHALLFSLVREIGLEDFDSRLILRDGAIVIFETRDLGDGGLEQVARRPGFASDWLDRSLRQLEACPQACRDACIACVRVDNASCHGFLYRELPRWMPPNLLMDRHLAIRWTEADASTAA